MDSKKSDLVKNFKCPVCETVGHFKNVDEHRVKKVGMHQCQTCGVVQYPEKYKTEEEILEYYRNDYRQAPQAANVFTGERKMQYHVNFLTPLFDEWKKAGIDAPVIGECGAAIGMFLSWVRDVFPRADINGTELTKTYRRVAKWFYNIDLVEKLDFSKKYDLIATYHVLEHQFNPDEELKKYADALKDSGIVYLSCPIWFRDASNSAVGGFDLEYYWAEDHINAWSEEHLEHIIERAGLEILTKDTEVYGNTYILKKAKNKKPVQEKKWDMNFYSTAIPKIKECWLHIQENRTALAIEVWRNCPAAWVNHYELNRKQFHERPQELERFLKDMDAACPNSADALVFIGDVLTRYERYDEAREVIKRALKRKPNSPSILMSLANTYRMKGRKANDQKEKIENTKIAADISTLVMDTSTEMKPQAMSWLFQDLAAIELPNENHNH